MGFGQKVMDTLHRGKQQKSKSGKKKDPIGKEEPPNKKKLKVQKIVITRPEAQAEQSNNEGHESIDMFPDNKEDTKVEIHSENIYLPDNGTHADTLKSQKAAVQTEKKDNISRDVQTEKGESKGVGVQTEKGEPKSIEIQTEMEHSKSIDVQTEDVGSRNIDVAVQTYLWYPDIESLNAEILRLSMLVDEQENRLSEILKTVYNSGNDFRAPTQTSRGENNGDISNDMHNLVRKIENYFERIRDQTCAMIDKITDLRENVMIYRDSVEKIKPDVMGIKDDLKEERQLRRQLQDKLDKTEEQVAELITQQGIHDQEMRQTISAIREDVDEFKDNFRGHEEQEITMEARSDDTTPVDHYSADAHTTFHGIQETHVSPKSSDEVEQNFKDLLYFSDIDEDDETDPKEYEMAEDFPEALQLFRMRQLAHIGLFERRCWE